MQPFSASDAVGLAFSHTRSVLGSRPFRLWRFFKLALIAAVTQATFFSVCFTYPLQGVQFALLSRSGHSRHYAFVDPSAGAFAALGVALLLVIALVLLLSLVYVYLMARARASLFDLVVFRGGRVREAWRRQTGATWRYYGLFLLATVLFWIVLAATLGPFLVAMIKTAMAYSSKPAAAHAIASQVMVLGGLLWLLVPIWIAADAILQDFILPGLALDLRAGDSSSTPTRDAFARFGGLLRRSPGQLLLYLLLRTVVALAIVLALGLVAVVILGVVSVGCYGAGRALHSALWAGGMGAHTVFFAAMAAMIMLVMALYLLAATAIYGVSGTFKSSYAALFFSGYYPELAAALTGPPPEEDELVGAGLPRPLPPMPPLRVRADLPPEVW